MSEDFDKEAEREKLRKQFAEEEEDRKSTQQMSELLLQGATMTNQHCPNCGDPVFRHNGQEFCPTCQAAGNERAQQAGGRASGDSPAQAGSTDGEAQRGTLRTDESRSPHEGAQANEGTQGQSAPGDVDASARSLDGNSPDEVTPDHGADARTPADAPPRERRVPADAQSAEHEGSAGGETRPAPASGDADDARANLQRSLDRFAAMAAATENPRQAKECLAAAREAAAALAELRR